MLTSRRRLLLGALALPIAVRTGPGIANAASARNLDRDAMAALQRLYNAQPKARALGQRAIGILIFPRVIKAGLIIGGQTGDGVLRKGGKSAGYYNISAASFGLQAGGQSFSYALFFMNDGSLQYLDKSDGWSIGSGPSVVVLDKGKAASLTSTTLTQDVYAVPFGQSGLMAGIGLEGSKITRINPSK
jgi:lipid-binding SYLF domain-containing protein